MDNEESKLKGFKNIRLGRISYCRIYNKKSLTEPYSSTQRNSLFMLVIE